MRPLTAALAFCLAAPAALAEEVGRVGVDWVGNDIVVESFPDPKAAGVTCHIAYFDRSVYDRLSQGNWFEDPSYSAVDCAQTGPITLSPDLSDDPDGERVFSERQSLILKSLVVTRIWDKKNNALVYLAHANELTQGSGKMSLSVIPLSAP
ncbi:MAG: CreA family protein [Rhodobacteraceae bacterium]|jgi:CreA protein|nr:CreA family protein [Paracoccaceae bacterium]